MDCDLTLWFYQKFRKHSVKKLRSKVVWITGASSGIGKALAIELARIGCSLIISGRDLKRLGETRNACLVAGASDDTLMINPFDVRQISVHQNLFNKVIDKFGKVDILVNNAGVTQRTKFETCSIAVDKDLFDVNVFGGINLSRILVNHWYNNSEKGHIVVTSSAAGRIGLPNSPSYTAAKHALHGYYESLRNECYFRDVAITIICPGPVDTPNLTVAYTGQPDVLLDGKAANRRMSSARQAQLMAYAIANRLQEAWTSTQPFLIYMYLAVYLPSLSKYLFPRLFAPERLALNRDG